jgi:YbbR domain-containing protein
MWLRSLIVDHFWLKLFSLILATLIWLAVRANVNNEGVTRRFDAADITRTFTRRPVQVMTDTGAHAAVLVEPDAVDIVVRGGAEQIDKLQEQQVRPFVRLPESTNLTGNVPVHVQLPREAALVFVSPMVVRVKPVSIPASNAPNP